MSFDLGIRSEKNTPMPQNISHFSLKEIVTFYVTSENRGEFLTTYF
jgi:hypothetical protein